MLSFVVAAVATFSVNPGPEVYHKVVVEVSAAADGYEELTVWRPSSMTPAELTSILRRALEAVQ